MSISGGTGTNGDDWQPPSWLGSSSGSSLFGTGAEQAGSNEAVDHVQSQQAPPPSPVAEPAPGADHGPPNTGIPTIPPSMGAQPDYQSHLTQSGGYRIDRPQDGGAGSTGRQASFGFKSSGSYPDRSTRPSQAIFSGISGLVVVLTFGRDAFFHNFVWFVLLFTAFGPIAALFRKSGNSTANRVCGAIGLALCVAAAIVMIVVPAQPQGMDWIFNLVRKLE